MSTDDEFKNYDTLDLVARDKEDDVRKYFSNGYSIEVGADNQYYESVVQIYFLILRQQKLGFLYLFYIVYKL